MKKKNYEEFAHQILELVGGKKNVSFMTHCVTRLRFQLKDESLADEKKIKALQGILGCQFSSGQFQVVVGTQVGQVYEILLTLVEEGIRMAEGIDTPKEKPTLKRVGGNIISNFTSCITPVLPVIICAGMIKTLIAVFGPTLLDWIQEGTGLFTILTFAGDAGFYFIPVFIGYAGAKQFKTNPFIGMLMGAILIHPSLVNIVSEGAKLDFLGVPVTGVNYANSVLPVILIVWIMSYVEKLFKRIVPEMFQSILVNFLTVLVMLPLGLCVLGPIGQIISGYLTALFLGIHSVLGPIGIGLIAAFYLLLILTGMHHAVNMAAVLTLTTVGYDNVIFVAATAATLSVLGTTLGFAVKAKKAENKSLGLTCTIMQGFAGVVEPTLFGIFLPYRRVLLAQIIGAFCGATLMGVLGCKMFALTGSNVFILVGYLGGEINNFIFACIGCAAAIVISFVLTVVLGFEEKQEGSNG